jgi:hypothetical protein
MGKWMGNFCCAPMPTDPMRAVLDGTAVPWTVPGVGTGREPSPLHQELVPDSRCPPLPAGRATNGTSSRPSILGRETGAGPGADRTPAVGRARAGGLARRVGVPCRRPLGRSRLGARSSRPSCTHQALPWHRLNFWPLPQGQGSLRPTVLTRRDPSEATPARGARRSYLKMVAVCGFRGTLAT